MLKIIPHFAEYPVHLFYGSDLAFHVSLMAAFVWRFHVKINVVATHGEALFRGVGFTAPVGAEGARSAFYVRGIHLRSLGDTFEKVHRRNNGAFKFEAAFEAHERRFGARSPEPYMGGGMFTRRYAFKVDGVFGEDFSGTPDEFGKHVTHHAFGEIVPHFFIGDVVRRGESHTHRAVGYDEAMTVTYSRIEGEIFVAQSVLNGADEFLRFRCGNFAGAIVEHNFILERGRVGKCHEIGTHRYVVVFENDAYAQSLERTSAAVIFFGFVAEHGEIGDVGAGLHTVGNCLDEPYLRACGKFIEIGRRGEFERSFAAELIERSVRHTVAEYDQVFHNGPRINTVETVTIPFVRLCNIISQIKIIVKDIELTN